ncbi:MAG: VCBS domain-containing protein, partial [Alphaproteobacteria bacterium]|nr:VCBS domain-containing protein [Alphaproteobacteria bacterium]
MASVITYPEQFFKYNGEEYLLFTLDADGNFIQVEPQPGKADLSGDDWLILDGTTPAFSPALGGGKDTYVVTKELAEDVAIHEFDRGNRLLFHRDVMIKSVGEEKNGVRKITLENDTVITVIVDYNFEYGVEGAASQAMPKGVTEFATEHGAEGYVAPMFTSDVPDNLSIDENVDDSGTSSFLHQVMTDTATSYSLVAKLNTADGQDVSSDFEIMNDATNFGKILYKGTGYDAEEVTQVVITVTASYGAGTVDQNFTVAIKDLLDEAPNLAAMDTVADEERTTAVNTYDEITPDISGNAISWALSGTDAASFSFDAATRALSFKNAPDYETDATSYTVIVTATETDANDDTITTSSMQTVTVNVTDINDEAPTLSITNATGTGTEDGTLTVSAQDLSIADADAVDTATSLNIYVTTGTDDPTNASTQVTHTADDSTDTDVDGTYGTFTFTRAADGSVTWAYALDNDDDDTDALAGGASVTDTAKVIVIDAAGATSSVVTLTANITGANDAPTVAVTTAAGTINQSTRGNVAGLRFTVDDPDAGEVLDLTKFTLTSTNTDAITTAELQSTLEVYTVSGS